MLVKELMLMLMLVVTAAAGKTAVLLLWRQGLVL
jgi:hypothetical protein